MERLQLNTPVATGGPPGKRRRGNRPRARDGSHGAPQEPIRCWRRSASRGDRDL